GAHAVLLDLRERDVDVVGSGEVARGADEGEVVHDMDDAGDRNEDVVLVDDRLAVHRQPPTLTLALAPVAVAATSVAATALTVVVPLPVLAAALLLAALALAVAVLAT